MSMELQLTPAQVEITQGIANKAYLKNGLASQLEYYKCIEVTPETMKDAKSDRADLNKLRTAIDDQRKAVKKHFTELYKPFEDDCKELIAMIDEPIAAIDSQMSALNDKRKAEKRAALEEYFEEICHLDFVRLEDILDPKWGNVTAKTDKLKEDMAAKMKRISGDFHEIWELYADSPMRVAIMTRFENTLDKGAALAYAAEIERRERAERERREQERLAAERVDKSFGGLPDMGDVKTTPPLPQPEQVGSVTFTVTGTKAQIIALRDFMKTNNINFTVKR